MTPLYFLDTNIVSYLLNGTSLACRERFAELRPTSLLAISSVTAAELYFGLDRVGAGPARRESLQSLLTELLILDWRLAEARTYGDLRAGLKRTGQAISPLDMLIVAHAVAVGAVLVTHDLRLQRIAALHGVEDWATDL